MAFASVIGQSEVKARLGAALIGTPGHAYIFAGPHGIGKNTVARAFAKALLCANPTAAGSCDHCPSCHYFERQVHPDFLDLRRDAKEKNIKVERVRQDVCADLNIRPRLDSRKVYLIAADDLNEQGQNALLKSLEEPPDYAFFLLTAVGSDHLLATVASRASLFTLRRTPVAEIKTILELNGWNLKEEAAFYARFAGGLPGVALELAGSGWFGDLRRDTCAFYLNLGQESRTRLLTAGYQFFDGNRPHVPEILDMLSSLVRDQLVLRFSREIELITNQDYYQSLNHDPAGLHPQADTSARLVRAYAAILAARRGLILNASFEGLICNLLLVLRKELSYA